MIIPLVMIGLIPSSMSVPRFEARMTRIQYSGSEESEDMIPYSGTWEQTKKIKSVTAVHSTFWLKGTWVRDEGTEMAGNTQIRTFRSGEDTSGRIGRKGLTRFKNRTIRY